LAWAFLGLAEAQAQTVFRLGHLFPTTRFEHLGLAKLAEMIGGKTGGKLKVEVFPAS